MIAIDSLEGGPDGWRPSRRRLLGWISLVVAGTAGCTTNGPDDSGGDGTGGSSNNSSDNRTTEPPSNLSSVSGLSADNPAFVTYHNERAGYRIDRPVGWVVDDAAPSDVRIEPRDEPGGMTVRAGDAAVATSVGRSGDPPSTGRVFRRRAVRLHDGTPGTVVTYAVRDGDTVVVGVRLVAETSRGDGQPVVVDVAAPSRSYTGRFDLTARTIVQSLTVAH